MSKPDTSMSHAALRILRQEHAALAAVLRSIQMLIEQGPGDQPERFFDVLRAMLFYIDEFPERLHHRKESTLLFPKLKLAAPQLGAVIDRLEADHVASESRVGKLQYLLVAWELIGEQRRAAFAQTADAYVKFYLDHMNCEESELLPAAERLLSAADWSELDRVFSANRDPLAGGIHDPCYDRLFTRIVLAAPVPVGVGTPMGGRPAP